MRKTTIEWEDTTINPVVGCSKISEGCKNCYAENMACRIKGVAVKEIESEPTYKSRNNKYINTIENGKWSGKVAFDETDLKLLNRQQVSKKIFVCSMGDIFHDNVKNSWIEMVMRKVYECSQHRFLFLTKRPERMKQFFDWITDIGNEMPENLWLGITAENQRTYDERMPYMKGVNPSVRFISFEPLLESIKVKPEDVRYIDWVILGTETGVGRRPAKINWFHETARPFIKAEIPVYVKKIEINKELTNDLQKFPKDLRLREHP